MYKSILLYGHMAATCFAQSCGHPQGDTLNPVLLKYAFLFLSFRRVLNVNYSFLGNSRRLSSNCRRFGTHYRFHLHRQVNEDGTDSEFRNVGN